MCFKTVLYEMLKLARKYVVLQKESIQRTCRHLHPMPSSIVSVEEPTDALILRNSCGKFRTTVFSRRKVTGGVALLFMRKDFYQNLIL